MSVKAEHIAKYLKEVWNINNYSHKDKAVGDKIKEGEPFRHKHNKAYKSIDKIGKLKSSHDLYHAKDKEGKSHYLAYNKKTRQTDLHMTAKEKEHEGKKSSALSNIVLSGRAGSKIKAHHLYHHLITKHNKMLVADKQSAGGKKVWQKMGKNYKDIHIHGWDGKEGSHREPGKTHATGNWVGWNTRSGYDHKDPEQKKMGNMNLVAHKKMDEMSMVDAATVATNMAIAPTGSTIDSDQMKVAMKYTKDKIKSLIGKRNKK